MCCRGAMVFDTVADSLTSRVAGLIGGAAVTDVHPMTGGFSSLTYRARVDNQSVIVKVAPPGRSPVGNRDVLRQARILQALHSHSTVPVPEVLFADPGNPPEVPPLFGMKFIDGDCLEPMAADRAHLPGPDVVRGRAQDLTSVLANLQQASTTELGLADEPVASDLVQVSRWMMMFRGAEASRALALGRRLQETAPEALAPVLQHGDFRLGNALCRGDEVVAVIDWEIWSIGDPRTDLAWLLMRAAPDQLHTGLPSAPGMPTGEALLAQYESEIGQSPSDLEWFSALARYKYAAVVSQMAARGLATDPRIAKRHAAVPVLLADVERLLQGRS